MKIIAIAALLAAVALRAGEPAAPPQAVLESSPEKGFRLSDAAQLTLQIETRPAAAGRLEVPDSAIIRSQDRVGIYRQRESWFKLVPVRIVGKSSGRVVVTSADLAKSDRVAVKGAALLRVTEMEIEGGGE